MDRLWDRVAVKGNDDCWLWLGSTRDGYGTIKVDGRVQSVHRLVYGPIPDGLEIDHLCRRPSCCNPRHLEAVTSQVNTLRGEGPSAKAARRTHCSKGHRYTFTTDRRRCLICKREANNPTGRPPGEKVGIVWDEQPLGSVPDISLARKLGVSQSVVQKARVHRRIASYKTGPNWDEQPLGLLSDIALARKCGVSRTAVRGARTRRGIPQFVAR